MCANCVTALDAMAVNSVGVAVLAANGWGRVRDALAGRTREQVAVDRYRTDAAFMRSLGLEPEAVLGPAPVPLAPVPEPHHVAD